MKSYLLVRTGDVANVAGEFDHVFASLFFAIMAYTCCHLLRWSAEGSTLTAMLDSHLQRRTNTLHLNDTALIKQVFKVQYNISSCWLSCQNCSEVEFFSRQINFLLEYNSYGWSFIIYRELHHVPFWYSGLPGLQGHERNWKIAHTFAQIQKVSDSITLVFC